MDTRFAFRSLARHKAFSLVAVLTLALGIGANTAIFSIVNGVLLRDLPFNDPKRLFVILENVPSLSQIAPVLPVSANHFTEWRRQCTQCEGMAALRPMTFNLTGGGPPERISGARVSANYFALLGVQLRLGAAFTENQDVVGNDKVVVMSDALWKRRFLADRAIVGRTIQLDGTPYTVLGVLPDDFVPPKGYELNPIVGFPARTDLWKPVAFTRQDLQNPFGNFNYAAIVRLKHGVTQAQVVAELDQVQSRITNSIPNERDRAEMHVTVLPMQAEMVSKARRSILLLMVAVGSVLLIVCGNLANLLLARATGRRMELAVRTALGASRSRLLRQMIVEAFAISVVGGALGLLVAFAGVRTIIANAPPDLPRLESIRIDAGVLAFTMVVAVGASLLFGFTPAWRASRSDPQSGLRGGRGQTDGRAGGRLRSMLVVAEVGMSVTLLITAGLLLRSFVRVMQIDRGFNEVGALAVDLSLPASKYPQLAQRAAFLGEALARLKTLPGVSEVGITNILPLSGHGEVNAMVPEGVEPAVSEIIVANYRFVNPGYFQAIGIPLEQGRLFEETDCERKVAIISQRTAARLWPGQSAIGKRFRYNGPQTGVWYDVVGVVGDVHIATLQETDTREMMMGYIPYWERAGENATVVLRTSVPPETLAAAVRSAIWEVDPVLPVPEFRTLEQIVSATLAGQKVQVVLVVAFAGVAIVLAITGIYGVVGYSVAQRRNEFGIRIALGASARQVLRMVLKQGMTLVGVGALAGMGGALALSRVLEGFLYRISTSDPVTYAAVGVIVLIAGVLACYVPARLVLKVDPARVLSE